MTPSTLLSALGAALLGSLHCAAMCGGLAAFATGSDPRARSASAALPVLLYNGGRLVVYALLGALAGAAGAALDLAGELAGVGRVAALITGGAMVLWSLLLLLQAQGARIPSLSLGAAPARWLSGALERYGQGSGGRRALLLGLGSALLPCGFLYGFVLLAAGTGSAARGALLLAAFWLGTVPALLGVGLAVRVLSSPLRRHVPTLTALALLAVGLWTLLARVNLPAQSAHAVRESVNLLTQDAKPSSQPAPGATCHH